VIESAGASGVRPTAAILSDLLIELRSRQVLQMSTVVGEERMQFIPQ